MRPLQIGVAGSSPPETLPQLLALAAEVGKEIAMQGAVLVFGGSEKADHLPNAAYRAAHAKGGMAIAVMEGNRRDLFAVERTLLIPSGEHGRAWERAMARPCDALIVIGGRAGTLEEMQTAYASKAPIVAILGSGGMADTWAGNALDAKMGQMVMGAANAKEAVAIAIKYAHEQQKSATT